jgi:hypothetical protein
VVKLLFKIIGQLEYFNYERLKITLNDFLKIWEYPDVIIFETDDSSDEQNILMRKVPK